MILRLLTLKSESVLFCDEFYLGIRLPAYKGNKDSKYYMSL